MIYEMRSELWRYPGRAAWHFLTLPRDEAAEIRGSHGGMSRGFGSLRVSVTIGETSWDTSIFPDSQSESYLLPVKAEVRRRENLAEGDSVRFVLEVR